MSCADELAELQRLPEWMELFEFIKRSTTTPRHCLSYQTTSSCQPLAALGPAGSLKACGLDTVHRQAAGFVAGLVAEWLVELLATPKAT